MSKILLSSNLNPALYASLHPGATGSDGANALYHFTAKDFIPRATADITTITTSDHANKFSGGVLAPNGKIYAIPANSPYVAAIDPVAKTMEAVISGFSHLPSKWGGGCLANNGKIYCCPNMERYVLIIDPATNKREGFPVTGNSSTWCSACLAPNGKIYCAPLTGDSFLVIDPATNTHSFIALPAVSPSGYQYAGPVLSFDGKIYCVPVGNGIPIIIIDPETDTIDGTSIAGTYSTFDYFGATCVSTSGRIVCAPYSQVDGKVLLIDTYYKWVNKDMTSPAETARWVSAVLAMDDLIYCIPHDASTILVVDTRNYVTSTFTLGTGSKKFSRGILAANGQIYAVPQNASYVGIINTNIPQLPPWMLAPEFNK